MNGGVVQTRFECSSRRHYLSGRRQLQRVLEKRDAAIEALRDRQVKNFFALELLAAGTPMLLMGEEVRRTQQGNNNAYCQDGHISWFDWRLLERTAESTGS